MACDSGRQFVRAAELYTLIILVQCCAQVVGAQTRMEDAVEVATVAIRDSPTGKGYATVEFEMRNKSPQVITAWAARVVATYANGQTESGDAKVDEVAYLLPVQKHLAWKPGSVRKGQVSVFRSTANDLPVSAQVTVRMLVFEDRTAIGDEWEISSFRKGRMTIASQEEQKANQIEAALSSPDPKARLREILDRRQRLVLDWAQQLYLAIERGMPLPAARAAAASFREYQTLLANHADIRKKES